MQATDDAVIWQPQPRQRDFLRRSEDEVLYGGAGLGGKTEAALMFQVRRREKHPGSAGLILRRNYTDLTREGALIPRSHAILKGRAKWNGEQHKWTYPNGSVTQFAYLDKSDDRYSYQGTFWEDITWEELTQFPRMDDYLFVNAYCRNKVPGCKPLVRATTNPGGIGHGWVKNRFVTPSPPNQVFYIDVELPDKRVVRRSLAYVPATLEDNPIGMSLNPNYEATLAQLSPTMQRALRYGDWDIAEGMVFADVWRREMHVISPFEIPSDWTRWMAVDWGFAAPFCALWAARSPDKTRIVVYRELYGPGHVTGEQAAMIRHAERNDGEIKMHVGDPSMWQKKHETLGPSVFDIYRDAGVVLTKANNNRHAGLEIVRKNLAWKRMPDGRLIKPPRVQFFDTCVNTIRTMPELPYDAIDKEDVDTEAEDHCFDTLKYLLMADGYRFLDATDPPDIVIRMA